MKILHRFVCLFLALAISFPLLSLIACNDSDKDGSDNVSSETEVKKMDYSSYSAPKIAKWYGNKKAAVTLTFDDGQIETGEYIAELFSDLGLRGTMFMILEHYLSERTPREGTAAYEEWISRWQSVADTGTLDIGNHSYHHYSNVMYRDGVSSRKDENYETEIAAADRKLRAYFPDQRLIGFATPGGGYCEKTRDMLLGYGYLANRTLGSGQNKSSPDDMMNITAVQLMKNTDPKAVKKALDTAIAEGNWYVELLHCVADENDVAVWPAMDSYTATRDFAEEHYGYIAARREDIFCGSFNDVAAYIIERDNTTFSYTDATENTLIITAETSFDDVRLDFPLTVTLEVPKEWEKVNVHQMGNAVYTVFTEDGRHYIRADLIPNDMPITLSNAN